MKMCVMVTVIFVLVLYSAVTTHFALNEEYCGWPAVTTCRMCEHRVWVWEDYERREWAPIVDNPQGLVITQMTMSSWFHTRCEGTPDFPPIQVRAY